MVNDQISLRLEKLERQVKLWRNFVVLLLVLCAAGAAVHVEANPNWIKTTRVDATAVVAREFDLVNAAGRVTARFAPQPNDPDFPYIVLKYPNDRAAVSIGVESTSGSSVSLLSNKDRAGAMMSQSPDGPSLSFFDGDDKPRVIITAPNSGPQISIYSKDRKRTVVASAN